MISELTRMILASPDDPDRERLVNEAIGQTGDPRLAQLLLSQGVSRERFLSSQAARGVSSGALGERERGLFDIEQGLERRQEQRGGGVGRFVPTPPPLAEPEPAPAPAAPRPPTATLTGGRTPPGPGMGQLPPDLLALREALAAMERRRREEPGLAALERQNAEAMRRGSAEFANRFPATRNLETPMQAFQRTLTKPRGLEALGDEDLARAVLRSYGMGRTDEAQRGLGILQDRMGFYRSAGRESTRNAGKKYHEAQARKLAARMGDESDWQNVASGFETREIEKYLASDDPQSAFEADREAASNRKLFANLQALTSRTQLMGRSTPEDMAAAFAATQAGREV